MKEKIEQNNAAKQVALFFFYLKKFENIFLNIVKDEKSNREKY